MPKIIKSTLTGFWRIVFKSLLVPLYKSFLFIKKYSTKYLVQNPYLSAKQIKLTSIQNSPAHIIIAIIFIFVFITNFTTRETYAEEFNRKSLVAQLLVTDIENEIVEKSPDLIEIRKRPKTETILSQLSAIEIKKNSNLDINVAREDSSDQIALSQGGEALIKPTISPFGEEDKPESTTPKSTHKEIQSYIVQSGDTIGAIATKFGVSVNTILWENNLSLSSYIRPGDKLTILPTTGVSYSVRSGDTLGAIARSYGTTIEKIMEYNNLESASNLKVRQKIIIPDGKLGYSSLARSKSIYSSSDSSPSTKNFLWPSSSKRITQYYHWRHHAIDIGAKTGTPIYASRGGRIERSGWSTGYGYNIVINHGGGVKTLYAHASALHVKRGDQVEQGQVIGAVGSTGWSTGPHIHYEIIVNGTKVNPLSYL
jgi:LysM repeat protein